MLAALALIGTASAVPMEVTQQGRLFDSTGLPFNGTHSVEVGIYSAQSGGAPLWSETQAIDFDEGYFAITLGSNVSTNALDDTVFDGTIRYVGITVDGGAEGPRQSVLSVPYAMRAASAMSVTDGAVIDAAEIRIDGTTVIDDTGAFTGQLPSIGQTLEGMTCAAQQVAMYDGANWVCASPSQAADPSWNDLSDIPADFADDVDNDTLAEIISCSDDDIPFFNDQFQQWGCRADRVLTDTDVIGFVTGGPIDLAPGSMIGGTIIQDTDTQLDEATVETYITNGALDLDAGTTIGLQPVSTLQLSDLTGQDFTFGAVTATSVDADDITVNGNLVLGAGSTCGVAEEGAIRYNSGLIEFCDGSGWVAAVSDTTPDAVSFSAVGNAQLGTVVTSNSVTVDGLDGDVVAAVYGDGTPMLSVNGGAYVAAATVANGDTVTVRINAPMSVGSWQADVAIGTQVFPWNVTTVQPEPTCLSILTGGLGSTDGVYPIDPDGAGGDAPMNVFCDMANGGWTYQEDGTPFRIEFTGRPVTMVTASVDTDYHFSLSGAAGGVSSYNGSSQRSGYGGIVDAERTFTASSTIYAYVGGQGDGASGEDQAGCQQHRGGYNGGGNGTQGGAAGGGGTDLRTELGNMYSRILVAGGGGGCGNGGCVHFGGHGGGTTAQTSQSGYAGGGQSYHGSNTSHYGSFGFGGDPVYSQCNDTGGGGGGWWGGNTGGSANHSAGGGSSYADGSWGSVVHQQGITTGNGYIEYWFR